MSKTAQAQEDRADTADRILDVAERLVQVEDSTPLAMPTSLKKYTSPRPSLHYHFPGKSELGEALIARYAIRFMAALGEIDGVRCRCASEARRLRRALCRGADATRGVHVRHVGGRARTLSAGIQNAVVNFFEENETWLAGVLQEGRDQGSLGFAGSPLEEARSIVSGLEGAMLVARSLATSSVSKRPRAPADGSRAIGQATPPEKALPGWRRT